jgi:pyruvate/2-oxoglutarate dehydrogenase complex dihydrolipoamide dehydrogenase (E3) component
MGRAISTDLCVIGAGSAGLSVAAGAAQMGARTVLIERGRMGGDCLNYGCVPSKALIAAARAAVAWRKTGGLGVRSLPPDVEWSRVRAHLQGVIAAIAPQDSEERFRGLGVRVIRAEARFTGPGEVAADGMLIRARRFVVATGSSPLVPPIPGLAGVPYLTNETVFELDRPPQSLVVLGGGPIGCELAQAFRRLGVETTVIEMGRILPKDDPEAVEWVRRSLAGDGMRLLEGAKAVGVEAEGHGIAVRVEQAGAMVRVAGSHLLVALGRRATVDGLGLEAAGIDCGPSGVVVDERLRTANRRVDAAGDVVGGPQFTHVAGYHAGIVLRNALLCLRARITMEALPWVTYTEPELAQVGLTEARARDEGAEITVLRESFAGNDRARTEGIGEGAIKVIAGPGGRVHGVTIAGPHAGELVLPWALVIAQRLKLKALATAVVPYPTLSEISKRAAGNYYAPKLFGAAMRRAVRLIGHLP